MTQLLHYNYVYIIDRNRLEMRPQDQPELPGKKAAEQDQAKTKMDTMGSLLAECVAGEVAKPHDAHLDEERAVWGDVFQSRQHFVDMHLC